MTTSTKPEAVPAKGQTYQKRPTRAQAHAAQALLHRARRGHGSDTPELREIAAAYSKSKAS